MYHIVGNLMSQLLYYQPENVNFIEYYFFRLINPYILLMEVNNCIIFRVTTEINHPNFTVSNMVDSRPIDTGA